MPNSSSAREKIRYFPSRRVTEERDEMAWFAVAIDLSIDIRYVLSQAGLSRQPRRGRYGRWAKHKAALRANIGMSSSYSLTRSLLLLRWTATTCWALSSAS